MIRMTQRTEFKLRIQHVSDYERAEPATQSITNDKMA